MDKRSLLNRMSRFFKVLYLKLFRIDDSPQKVALGFGLGVFLGVMPGMGPIAALAVALLIKANRIAALLGSILTNTWLSIPVFFLAVKTGSAVTGVSYDRIKDAWFSLIGNFGWDRLARLSLNDVLIPVIIGYAIVSLAIGVLAYVVAFLIVKYRKNGHNIFARFALLAILSPKARAFENATKDPVSAQKKVLFEYLARNCDTEYGKACGFSGIKSIEDYRKAVPLSNCESIRPYIKRMEKGEKNILTKDPVIFFGATSGTTAEPKYIPTTRFADKKKALLTDIWSYYVVKDHPNVLDGKILALISPQVEGYTESGISYGAESGHGYREISPFVKGLYALPYRVFEIEDYDARYYTILRMAIEKNVTTIATLNPNTISLLCQKVASWQDRIIRDIGNGTLDAGFKIEKDIRRELETVLRPNRKRSRELERIIAEKGELLPKYFWPRMALIECWKAGMMSMYLKELTKYFGEIPIRDMGCLSTEARSSIPMTDSGAGGVLAIETNFYEFIPKEDAQKGKETCLTCDAIREGKEYFLVVTTAAGLYRYNIDDLVRVDGFFNKTPIIEFVQKGIGASSLAGEKLYESQVNDALNSALSRMSLLVEFFCALAEPENGPRYSFLVEFTGTLPSLDGKKRFLYILEEELRRHNREYDFTRNAKLLGSPVLKVVGKGEFEKYRVKRISEGAHDGQFKTPELTKDESFQCNFLIEEEIELE